MFFIVVNDIRVEDIIVCVYIYMHLYMYIHMRGESSNGKQRKFGMIIL